jgi:hypothetical protein
MLRLLENDSKSLRKKNCLQQLKKFIMLVAKTWKISISFFQALEDPIGCYQGSQGSKKVLFDKKWYVKYPLEWDIVYVSLEVGYMYLV